MTATLNINEALNGIEISFSSKPITATLEALKNLGFRWHNTKKLWYAKNTPERLEMAQIIANTSEYAEKVRQEEPKKAAAKKAETVNKYGVKVGDVFYDSWGYEQTNIDFYQVVALKGKTQIVLKAIKAEHRNVGFCSDMVKPIKDSFKDDGGYITHLISGTENKLVKTVKDYGMNGSRCIYAGDLRLTTWDAEHNETSYY